MQTLDSLAQPASLAGVLDRLLATGVVLQGELIISVADVDLLYVGLNLVLSSVDALRDKNGCP